MKFFNGNNEIFRDLKKFMVMVIVASETCAHILK